MDQVVTFPVTVVTQHLTELQGLGTSIGWGTSAPGSHALEYQEACVWAQDGQDKVLVSSQAPPLPQAKEQDSSTLLVAGHHSG